MRPDFIPAGIFSTFQPISVLNAVVEIDGESFAEFIARLRAEGAAIQSLEVNGRTFVKLKEVLNKAHKKGCLIATVQHKARIKRLTANPKTTTATGVKENVLSINEICKRLTGCGLLTEKQLLNKKENLPDICAVYFLFKGDTVVYVGQSVNLHRRIGDHMRSGKLFDGFSYIPCSKEYLDVLESIYIHAFQPKYNFATNERKHVCSPLQFADLLSLTNIAGASQPN